MTWPHEGDQRAFGGVLDADSGASYPRSRRAGLSAEIGIMVHDTTTIAQKMCFMPAAKQHMTLRER